MDKDMPEETLLDRLVIMVQGAEEELARWGKPAESMAAEMEGRE
jgi:hypothetical protein